MKLSKNKLYMILALLLSMLLCFVAGITLNAAPTAASATEVQYADDTEGDVYLISSAEEMLQLSKTPGDWNKHFKLTANIDLKNDPWTPIGTNNGTYFTGTFDGDNHTISGLYIDSTAGWQGLFGYVKNGTIKNLKVEGTVIGNANVGGIVGYLEIGTVEKCSFEGTVKGGHSFGQAVGGIAGYNHSGTIKECNNNGTVTSECMYAGGIVGHNEKSAIVIDCENTGTISLIDNNSSTISTAGGIVGINVTSSKIINCSNEGNIGTGSNLIIGGIVGTNNGASVTQCYNTGIVTGRDYIGGVAGQNIAQATITQSYNTGAVSGANQVGGVAGQNDDKAAVTNCYNTATVTGSSNVGGLVGKNCGGSSKTPTLGTVTNCYNRGTVTGNNSGGVVGLNKTGTKEGTVENCYYLTDTASGGGAAGALVKTQNEFASGEVTWLLQKGQPDYGIQVWGQWLKGNEDTIDPYPVLTNELPKRVWQVKFHQESEDEDHYVNNNKTVDSDLFGSSHWVYEDSKGTLFTAETAVTRDGVLINCEHGDMTYTKNDDDTHTGTCNICGEKSPEEHHRFEYEDNNDGKTHKVTCEKCDYEKDKTHGKSDWQNDEEQGHYYLCGDCNAHYGYEDHEYVWSNADGWHLGICSTCEYWTHHEAEKWGEWSNDGDTHTRDCKVVEGCTVQDSHTAEYIYTDNENGETHTVSCKTCGYEKDKNEAHRNDGWQKDENGHNYKCLDCGAKYEVGTHGFAAWTTVEVEGEIRHVGICSACGYLTNHKAGNWDDWNYDGDTHSRKCLEIDCTIQDSHSADYKYDANEDDKTHTVTCKTCGYTKDEMEEHRSDGTLYNDEKDHYYECLDCGAHYGKSKHELKYVSDGESGHHQKCEICTYEETETAEHTSTSWQYTDKRHYHECEKCSEKYGESDHDFEWTEDEFHHEETCITCGYGEDGAHFTTSGWHSDGEKGHYHECDICNAHYGYEAHQFNWEEEDDKHVGTCICGYNAPSHDAKWDEWTDNVTTHSHKCLVDGCTITNSHESGKWSSEWTYGEMHSRKCDEVEDCTIQDSHFADYKYDANEGDKTHTVTCTKEECNYKVTENHRNDGNWQYEESGHYHQCLNCNVKYEKESHELTWTNVDGWHLGICSTCKYWTHHEPEKWGEWSYDGDTHTRDCKVAEGCTVQDSHTAEYNYKANEDDATHTVTCTKDGCRYEISEAHRYDAKWSNNEKEHYYECLACGAQHDNGDHEFAWTVVGVDSENRHVGICTACGYLTSHEAIYWSPWETLTEAECTTKGLEEHTCTVCGKVETRETDELGHDFTGEWKRDSNDHWKECQRDNCNTASDKEAHKYGDWTYADGEKHSRVCGECMYVETDDCVFTDVITPPTCTKKGYVTHTCTICAHSYDDNFTDALGHDFTGKWKRDANGHWKECLRNNCNAVSNKSAHKYSKWAYVGNEKHRRICSECDYLETNNCVFTDVITPPTCTEKGFTTRTCTLCGHTYTANETDALGHDFTGEWESDADGHWKECQRDNCNAVSDKEAHKYGEWAYVAEEKHSRVCSECAYGETNDCVFTDVITSPTCTEKGFTTRTCTVCGHTYTADETDALGHDFTGEWKHDKDSHWHDCSRCDAQEISTHVWGDWETVTEAQCLTKGLQKRNCEVCGQTETRETNALGHDFIHHSAKPAACLEKGWKEYDTCSRCDYTTYEETDALGHDWGEPVWEWSDDFHRARVTVTCKRCGETFTSEWVSATQTPQEGGNNEKNGDNFEANVEIDDGIGGKKQFSDERFRPAEWILDITIPVIILCAEALLIILALLIFGRKKRDENKHANSEEVE